LRGLADTVHSVTPQWNESKFLLVNSLNEILTMDVYDYNDHRKDTELGSGSFDLQSLQDDAEQEDLVSEVMLGGKPRGTLKFDLRFFPVMKTVEGPDGTEEPLPESSESSSLSPHGLKQELLMVCTSRQIPALCESRYTRVKILIRAKVVDNATLMRRYTCADALFTRHLLSSGTTIRCGKRAPNSWLLRRTTQSSASK
jgi:hypothetical protein